ncbi:MAG: ATP phosphoribosyltransferase regulatory subunit [Burkholderiales bacterium]|jgi:ATP phosphoribosyltransferase regulatory subunit|nr:ATP phosphoribosyltransferase regulatory subunit [Burkholderiales bacterium]MCA3161905.1 ATP phosphoribosyltransferase regulatory subunit [Burkholderiales bacterium]MCA3163014.1 ATP phosphoribosyltransferase regulatory subunit [Burkholderiales bacterium]MCA3165057.1 ATP phosphoribosyltransferase regulatory subunit [Burkholderiales bacterium]MCA3169729.1 ATP phosphoribosyltransferase regulatory subunit [Burkholderiales bacterium]
MAKWLLPEYIADVLPAEARHLEALRRGLLDLYGSYGYELVMPPLLEYLDSLLTGTGQDLNLRTFKLVDQLSGKTMGLRADITPQVARIDAHLLNREGVVRLCYAGSVLHTRPAGMNATREPLQVGAELYGHAGLEADLEIAELALASLALVQADSPRLDLSHMGVIRALLQTLTAPELADEVVAMVRRKDKPGLRDCPGLPEATRRALQTLCGLYGGIEILQQARVTLPEQAGIHQALDELQTLAQALGARGAQITIDLGEMRGYQYHSGIVFAAYCHNIPSAVIRGGRYDQVGQAFGRARAATGFSLDLRELAALAPTPPAAPAILAPWSDETDLQTLIAHLRVQGNTVVQALPGHEPELQEYRIDRVLKKTAQGWQVTFLEK